MPHLTYGSVVMTVVGSTTMEQLQVVFNDCIRFIFSLNRRESVSMHARDIFGCTLTNQRKFEECKFMYLLIHERSPSYLYEILSPSNSMRMMNYKFPMCHSEVFQRSYFAHAVAVWNSLPDLIRRKPTPATFASACLEYFSKEK